MADIREQYKSMFPELARFASDEEARDAYRAGVQQARRSFRFWLLLVVIYVALPAFLAVAFIGLPFVARAPVAVRSGVIAALIASGGLVLFHWGLRKPVRSRLRRELAQRGVPVCVECGYDLRGQAEPRCPECGAACAPELLNPSRVSPAEE